MSNEIPMGPFSDFRELAENANSLINDLRANGRLDATLKVKSLGLELEFTLWMPKPIAALATPQDEKRAGLIDLTSELGRLLDGVALEDQEHAQSITAYAAQLLQHEGLWEPGTMLFASAVETARDFMVYGAKPRHPQWPKTRAIHLEQHPECACCGCTREPEVHHVLSFHEHPELELDPNNLITLCNLHNCHFLIGHLCKWTRNNPNVRQDAAVIRERIAQLATA